MKPPKPPFYDHDRRALSDAVRRGDHPDRVRELTRRAIEAQMKLFGPAIGTPRR